MDFLLRQAPPLLWEARERLAAFLGTEPKRLVFTANVSAAINIVAAGLRLTTPGEILMSDREYGSMQWTWERAARRQGLAVRFFKLPLMPRHAGDIVDAVRAAMTRRTRLLLFSHVLSATGLVLPAKELCDLARRHGVLTMIDGAHAPAMIPVSIDDLGCDFYGGNCHKWLLAPIGSGFFALGRNAVDRLEPLQVSWGYHYDRARADERDDAGSTPRLRSLEFEGTRDPCAWLAVPDAIDFQARLGWDAVRRRIRFLVDRVRERFDDLGGLRLTTPADPSLSGAMTAFWWPAGPDDEWLRQQLWARRIEALINKWPEGNTLRISTHFYTTQAELGQLADAIPRIADGP
ncbi:MAG TPA: aminotransferase class V-fold PLP-dependent enzyme, partial [Gemmataceae bacterium]|jgi:isopenicillin-N epimerase|nr:aminotransferase class V-fold PLP-dependent enzyme [Gemmataceae bacterium]